MKHREFSRILQDFIQVRNWDAVAWNKTSPNPALYVVHRVLKVICFYLFIWEMKCFTNFPIHMWLQVYRQWKWEVVSFKSYKDECWGSEKTVFIVFRCLGGLRVVYAAWETRKWVKNLKGISNRKGDFLTQSIIS